MKRKDAIAWLRVAGYHNDERTGLRIYTESRLSYHAYREAWNEGARAKNNGMKCYCAECISTP